VTIEDEVEFSSPSTFETVLTTRANETQESTNVLHFTEGAERVAAVIKTSERVTFSEETISEMSTPPYKRIGLKLAKPVSKATVQITIKQESMAPLAP
jgi:hypothetical protein